MGSVNKQGVWIYDADDTVSTWEGLLNLGQNALSNSLSQIRRDSVYKAANMAAANTVRDRVIQQGVTPSKADPILVYLSDTGRFIAWDGAGWNRDGASLSAWNISGDGTVDIGAGESVAGVMVMGKAGSQDKFRFEHGSAVIKTGSARTAWIPLKAHYQGISTVIACNGDTVSSNYHIAPTGRNWRGHLGGGSPATTIEVGVLGAPPGTTVRINYLVIGWIV